VTLLRLVREEICTARRRPANRLQQTADSGLLLYQPFDLLNKQLFQPSYFFSQQLVYGLEYNGDVVVFRFAPATACRVTNDSFAGI